ncbi:MAG: thiamine diphosphokinase [Caldisericia bacterium]|nr:thiamine diphosphokinase [Caldisericia bacterium]
MAGTALIVLAGDVTKKDFETVSSWNLAVAVDAGMAHFLSFGLKPDILLGDFDSIQNSALEFAKSNNIEIVTHPARKDKSDGELALEYVSQNGFSRAILLGVNGGQRPDHIAFNLALFHLEQSLGLEIKAISQGFEIFSVNGFKKIESKPDVNVSVMAFESDIHVKLSGLDYPLDGLLRRGSTLGLSNVALGDFTVETSGKALVFVQRY